MILNVNRIERFAEQIDSRNGTVITVVVLAVIAFLLLFIPRSEFQTGDSLWYALNASTGDDVFHPHHLLYIPFVYVVHTYFITQLCSNCDSILSAQLFNIGWAIVIVTSTFVLVKLLTKSYVLGLASSLALLVSSGLWFFSTQVEVYVPAMGCMALVVLILVWRRNSDLTWNWQLTISILFALSVFFHQTNVLFAIPLGYALITRRSEKDYRPAVIIIGSAGVMVLAGYILAFLTIDQNKNLATFLEFNLDYAYHPATDWGTFAHFSPGGVFQLIRSQLEDFVALEGALKRVAVFAFALTMALLLIWNLHQAFRGDNQRKTRQFLLIWLAVYFIFFLWWLPREREFFIVTLLPMVLLGILMLKDLTGLIESSRRRQVVTAAPFALVVVIAAINAQSAIIPSFESKGDGYTEASRLAPVAPEECTVLTLWEVEQNLRYYFDRSAIDGDFALIQFYDDEPLRPAYSRYVATSGDCFVVRSEYFQPDRTAFGHDGYSSPEEWLSYLDWLLKFEYDSTGQLVSSRAIELIEIDDETFYVHVSQSRLSVDGIDGLVILLDRQFSEYSGAQSNIFQEWHRLR